MKYAVVFEKTATGYSAYVPDLPGCIAAGATLEETTELIRGGLRCMWRLFVKAANRSASLRQSPAILRSRRRPAADDLSTPTALSLQFGLLITSDRISQLRLRIEISVWVVLSTTPRSSASIR